MKFYIVKYMNFLKTVHDRGLVILLITLCGVGMPTLCVEFQYECTYVSLNVNPLY